MDEKTMTLKIVVDGVIIPASMIAQIYIICQFLKDLLSNTLFKWILKLLGKEEWLKYVPYILPYIVAFITWYGTNPDVWQDGLTLKELWLLIIYMIGPQVMHRELRKLSPNGVKN